MSGDVRVKSSNVINSCKNGRLLRGGLAAGTLGNVEVGLAMGDGMGAVARGDGNVVEGVGTGTTTGADATEGVTFVFGVGIGTTGDVTLFGVDMIVPEDELLMDGKYVISSSATVALGAIVDVAGLLAVGGEGFAVVSGDRIISGDGGGTITPGMLPALSSLLTASHNRFQPADNSRICNETRPAGNVTGREIVSNVSQFVVTGMVSTLPYNCCVCKSIKRNPPSPKGLDT